jgi:hypothetical protein
VYIRFTVHYMDELEDIKQEIKSWSERYNIHYTHKTIKYYYRVGFNEPEHFSLFTMTWNPKDLDRRPWLNFQIINVISDR